MKRFIAITLFLLGGSACVFADLTIVRKVEAGTPVGKAELNALEMIQIKSNKARVQRQGADDYEIYDLKAGKVYSVRPKKKQVIILSLAAMRSGGAALPDMTADTTLDVKEAGETTTINGFQCSDVVITGAGKLSVRSKQCLSTAPGTEEFDAFRPFVDVMTSMLFGARNSPAIPRGFPVRSETTIEMMGQSMTAVTEVQSISLELVPDSLFVIPQEYLLVELP
jgi:hypothetical protein